MDLINSNEDILGYLLAPCSEEEQGLLNSAKELIEATVLDPAGISESKWKEFSLRRLMGSNSLSAAQEMSSWDRINSFIYAEISQGENLSIDKMKEINAILQPLENGSFRDSFSSAGDKIFIHPADIPEFVEAFASSALNSKVACPIWQAFLVYSWGISIHPFLNGNGRTFRAASDWVLLERGYFPLSFSNHVSAHVGVARNCPLPTRAVVLENFLKGLTNSYNFLSS